MHYYLIALAIVAGTCFAFGILFLFTGLRRKDGSGSTVLFSLFALSYGAVILTGIANYSATSVEDWLSSARLDGVFVVLTWCLLIGYVALYTGVKPRIFLALLLAAFVSSGIANVVRPNLIHDEILGLASVTLPWGEQLAYVEATDSLWATVFLVANLVTIGYVLVACTLQFRRGERQPALVLGAGMAWFIMTVIVDILVDLGIAPLYLGDFGFLGLAIVLGLQLTNEVMRTEEELAGYRQSLETLVQERTAELETANDQLAREMAERLGVEQALRRSESAARALINAPPDSALLLDAEGIIMDLSEVAADRLGLSLQQARGRYAFDLFEPQIAETRRAKLEEAVTTKRPVRWQDRRAAFVFDNTFYPILDDQGEVTRLAAFAVDITERIRSEEALERSVEELAGLNAIARAVTDVTELPSALAQASEIVTDLFAARYTHVIWAEGAGEDSFVHVGHERGSGHTGPTPLDLDLSELPVVGQVLRETRSRIVSDVRSLTLPDIVREFLVERYIQSILLVPLAIRREAVGVLTIASDKPEHGFNEDEVRLAETIATDLAAAIEGTRLLEQAQAVAVSEERSRLARELHDSVTQILFSVNLIALSLGRLWKRNPEMAARSTDELQRLTRGALAEMRTLLRELRPQTIVATELSTLLKQLSDSLTARHDIPVYVEVGQLCEIPPEVHVALYRVAQEALSNVAKHAEASRAAVELVCEAAAVQLTITDDGQGFDPNDVQAECMGLDIMRERVNAIGAAMTTTSQPGAGTSIVVTWPIPQTGGDSHAKS
ncbi:histidine kinase [Chloroflexota bacterium]